MCIVISNLRILMRTPDDNHIVLIPFNIALSLSGEDAVIGCSAGYASPEHHGLDFASDSDTVNGESEIGGGITVRPGR